MDDAIAEFEAELDRAERRLASIGRLTDRQTERVAARMDRLASQILEVSDPPVIDDVHRRLGTEPASSDDFASLVDGMGPGDGEG